MASAGSIFVDILLNDSRYVGGLNNAQRKTRQAANAWQRDINRTRDSFQSVISPIDNIGTSVARLGGIIASALSVQQLVRYSDTWKQLEGRLNIVSESMSEVQDVQASLFEIAQRTRQPLEGITSFYTRLTQFVPEAERGMFDLLGVTESVSTALALTGETGASATAAMIQFTQAIGTNFEAAGQEIRSIQEQAPRLAIALQRALGDGTQSLKELKEEGILTRQSVLNALSGIGEEGQRLREELSQVTLTVGQAFQRLDNAFLQFIGQSESVRDGTSSIALAVSNLAENLDTVATAGIAVAGVFGARMAASLASTSTAFVLAQREALAYQFALTRGIATNTAYRASLVGVSAAASVAGRALALLGGPVGAALTLAGGAALYLSTQQDAAAKAASDHAKQLKIVTSAADEAATSFNDLASATYNEQLARLNSQLLTAQDNIKNITDELRFGNFGGIFDAFERFGTEFNAQLRPLRLEFTEGRISVDEYLDSLFALAAQYPEFTDQVENIKRQVDALKASELAADDAREALEKLNFIGPAAPALPDAPRPTSKPLQEAAEYAERVEKELNKAYERNLNLIKGISSESQKYIETQQELIQLERAGKISKDELNLALVQLSEKYTETDGSAKRWADNIEKYGERAAENIQDAFADFLFNPFEDGLQGMLLAFVNVLRRMLAEAISARLLESIGGNFFSNFLGSFFGGTGGGVEVVGGTSITSPFAGLPGFADGGYLPPGQFGVAGEEGAELIYGGRTGMTVIPPSGNGGNTYYIDAQGADSGTVRRLEQALLALAGPGVIEQRVTTAQKRGKI